MKNSSTQTYCDYLGISCPSIADYVGRHDVRPIQLFALTILVHSRPMELSAIADFLTTLGWKPATGDPTLSLKKAYGGRLPIVQLPSGLYDIELNCIELSMRFRELGIRVTRKEHAPYRSIGLQSPISETSPIPKRVLIHGFHTDGKLVAITLLDIDERSLQTLYDEDIQTVLERLKEYPVVIGLEPRSLLAELGIEDVIPWRLIDLARHPKSKQINKRGRKLNITTEMLITSSTGISNPLGNPVKMHEYWSQGKNSSLTKRLESDAKSLYSFYRYGSLHNGIRLRWGFLSESFLAEWGVPGELSLYVFLRLNMESGEPIEFVRGTAPGWSDPWSRGKRGIVTRVDYRDVELLVDNERVCIAREEFQAVR